MVDLSKTQNNKGAIAIFVKTPSLTPVKTRLAATIGHEKATEFFNFCTEIIEEIVNDTIKSTDHTLVPYWAVAEKDAVNLWHNFSVIHTGPGSLGMRLHNVYSTLLKEHSYVVLLGADSLTLTANIISTACHMVQQSSHFIVGPAYDGGFYLFAGNKIIPATVWQSVTYSTNTTLKQLSTKLAKLAKIKFLQPLLDVDTYDDLALLSIELKSIPALLPAQKRLLSWLNTLFIKVRK
jgi:glycosyltransferase A (GT-A) superfamily protein (DUF2064 family)